jgi:hypothetical protein
VRAILDAQFRSPHVRNDARRFLEADDRSREILRLLVQISGINRAWFRRRLGEVLDRAAGVGVLGQRSEKRTPEGVASADIPWRQFFLGKESSPQTR